MLYPRDFYDCASVNQIIQEALRGLTARFAEDWQMALQYGRLR